MDRTLDEIALKYKTDKSSRQQGYTNIYPLYLEEYREDRIVFLEIGVHVGRSIRMWRDYFPNADLFGIEKYPRHEPSLEKELNEIFIGDQEDRTFLKQVSSKAGPFNVIIDDGGHKMNQQITSFEALWPHIKPNGLYVIEDIDTSYREEFGGGLKKPGTLVEYMKNKIDEVASGRRTIKTDIKFMHFYEELVFIGKKA